MLYYLGRGTEFKKEDCKEYKTIEGAMRAAAKDENLVVWDENGNIIGSLTDNVPEGALQTDPDGSVNAYDEDGNKNHRLTHGQRSRGSVADGSGRQRQRIRRGRKQDWDGRCRNR